MAYDVVGPAHSWWRSTFWLCAILIVLSCSASTQPRGDLECGDLYRVAESASTYYAASIVPAQSFVRKEIPAIAQRCIDRYGLEKKEIAFLVFGTSTQDALSIYNFYKPAYLYFDQWQDNSFTEPKPNRIAVLISLRGVSVLRVWDGGRLTETHIDLDREDLEHKQEYRFLVDRIRQVSIAVNSKEMVMLGRYVHRGSLSGLTIYVADPQALEHPEDILDKLRSAITGGDLSVYISSAPCFRTAQSFPYWDLDQTASGRCVTDPSFGEEEVFCTASPSGDWRYCRKTEPLRRREK